ncbi:Uncharacterized protein A9P81_1502 [Leptospira interrogans serovar Copenhageni/Icterohaemorrhagiae]|nr:Uncharacterized protein A9P81_1502 [Leptospira interrogans serovar Copenhageni/Icterohaemorrhagiae]
MEWEKVLRDSVKDNKIKELHLRKVPTLKTCDDWSKVREIGLIDHKSKYAHYKGGLVKYGDALFLVTDERLQAIAPYRKWEFKSKIKVEE